MKTVKKIAAVILCAALMLSCVAGCHGKDAVVASVTLDKKEYTVPSGLYLTLLINADSEARSKVTEAFEEAEKDTEDINFSKQKVTADDKKEYKFNDYVVMRAKEMVAEYLVTAYMFDKYKLELSDENASSMEQYVAYQWSYSGNAYLFEPNGVNYDSFEEYMRVNMYYRSDIFDYFYKEGGEKAPEKKDIETALKENFTAANVLEIAVTDDEGNEMSEDELKAIADKIEAYCTRINDGDATFADIKAEYEAETNTEEETEKAETDATEEETTTEETEEEENKPKDENATVLGNTDTSVASDLFEDVSKSEVGKAVLLKGTDGYYRLVINQDILADEYYYTTYRDETVRIMHADDFNDYVAKEAKKLKINYNSYELDYLKPKKISYDEYNQWYSDMLSTYGQ